MMTSRGAKNGEWYSKLKRMTRYDQDRAKIIPVDEINHLNEQDQAEMIASHQARISNTYKEIERSNIDILPFGPEDIPQLTESIQEVYSTRGYPCQDNKIVFPISLYPSHRYYKLQYRTRAVGGLL